MEFPHDNMIEMANIVMKYSKEQLGEMLYAVNLDELQDDMIRNGATKEELRKSSKLFFEFYEFTYRHKD